MKKTVFICGFFILSAFVNISAGMLYSDRYMSRSGIVAPSVDTGLPSRVSGDTLLHWRGYMFRFAPIVFRGDRMAAESKDIVGQIKTLIRQNRAKISYISIIGHSSSVADDENRIELGGWSGLWQSLGGDPRLDRDRAVKLVNNRIRDIYDIVSSGGISPSRIYTENRLDRELLYTEATASGRLGNNRVEVTVFSLKPLNIEAKHNR